MRFEVSVDAYNLTNANTVHDARTDRPECHQYAGDVSQFVTQIATFMSPTTSGPRTSGLTTHWFGGGTRRGGQREGVGLGVTAPEIED